MVMLHINIKGNETYNNMLANSLPLHTPLTSRVGSNGQLFFFSESCHVAYQINRNEADNTMQANILLLHAHDPWMG